MQRTKVREKDYVRFIWFCSFILKYRDYAYEKASEEEKPKYSFDSINSMLNVKGLLFVVYRLKLYQDEKVNNKNYFFYRKKKLIYLFIIIVI